MTMPNLKALHHVAMVTNDLAKTREFSCDFMGGAVVFEGGLHHGASAQCFIALGNSAMLEFFEFPDIEMPDWTSMFLGAEVPKAGRILEHVAFYVDTEDELVTWQEKVAEAGIPVVRPPGRNVIFFPDPNSATVQIIVDDPRIPLR
jgi:catechol 2,3-dioxygenase-like lactoylglutathione lyase family enzyme